MADEILEMRRRLEESRPPDDVKRGVGGQADVEFAVQTTQILRGREVPEILVPNILDAIGRMRQFGLWPAERCETLAAGYRLLRTVESRLRIVYNVAKNQLPADSRDVEKLAHRTGYGSSAALLAELRTAMAGVRAAFLECIDEARRG
jgi:glutamate-ammonia-ligase adenylyltransferase